MRHLLIFSFVILLAATGLSQTVIEQPAASPIYGPAPSDQFGSVVGSNGTDFLVAWFDGRAWLPAIYATRVSTDGRVLDGTGIRIPLQIGNFNARLVGAFWIDDAYTVIYAYQGCASPNGCLFTGVARIDDRGDLIEPPRVVADFPARSAASNNSRIVIAGADSLAVLDDHSQLLNRLPLPGGPAYGINVGTNGATFLVSSFSYDRSGNWVNFAVLDGNGNPTGWSRIAASGIGDGPIIGSDGVDYLVLYRNALSGDVAQRVTAAGVIGTSVPGPSALSAVLLWTGDHYFFSETEYGFNIASLDQAGNVISPATSVPALGTPGVVNVPSIAMAGSKVLMTFTNGTQSSPDGWDVAGMLLSVSGQPLSDVLVLTTSSNPQRAPAIATGGRRDLVVWDEPSGIYGARVSAGGSAIDGRGIRIAAESIPSRGFTYGAPREIRVIFDGDAYLVAWIDRTLNAQRVDGDTGLLLGSLMTLAPCATSFDLERDGSGTVLFATDCSGALFAQRVALAGPVGPSVTISPPQMGTSAPRAAWNGNEWLIAFNQLILIPTLGPVPIYRHNVYAERLSPSLSVIDVAPIPIDVSAYEAANPVVATNGRDFLVLWTRSRDSPGVYGRHINADGSFGDSASPPGIPAAVGANIALNVVWDGSRYGIEYSTTRDDGVDEVRLTHVATDVPVGDRIGISLEGADTREADVVVSAPGRLRTVYARTAVEPEYGGVTRIFTRDILPARQRAVRKR